MALTPVIVIERRRAELAGSRVGPCTRVQDECRVRIETVAVQVLGKERHSGNAILDRVLEYDVAQRRSGRGSRRRKRKSAGVLEKAPKLPIANGRRQNFVLAPSGQSVVDPQATDQRTGVGRKFFE